MSDNYSTAERFIARLLNAFPQLKTHIKYLYSLINLIIHRKPYKYLTHYTIKSYSYQGMETFFGYYDKSPYNSDKKYIIYNSTSIKTVQKPNALRKINIILFDTENNIVKANYETCAYNWQQGAKAMWLDNEHFIFNDYSYEEDKYIAHIVVAHTGEIKHSLDFAIYDANSKIGFSLSFDRLAALRPDYGYFNRTQKYHLDRAKDNEDGIFKIDIENNTSKLFLSLTEIKNIEFIDDFTLADHKVNHLMLSPNGGKLIFLHRWFKGKKRNDRLMVVNSDGTDLKSISSDKMVSHCFWLDDMNVVGYMRDKNLGDNYYTVSIDTKEKKILDSKLKPLGDGHPSIHKNILLFDTYPNKARMKGLYLYNIKNKKLDRIGEFFEPLKYNGVSRCDLHPRWSPDGKSVFIDSVHSGKRSLYEIILKNVFK